MATDAGARNRRTDRDNEAGPAIHFVVAFWGSEFRGHFLRLCAASLLAEGNLPAVTNKSASRLVICTTTEDWAAISDEPTYRAIASIMATEFVEIRRPVPAFIKAHVAEVRRRRGEQPPVSDEDWAKITVTPSDVLAPQAYAELEAVGRDIGNELNVHFHYALRIHFMGAGHKAAARAAHRARACAVFLAPDMMLSAGSVRALEESWRRGKKVVMAPALRFRQAACLDAFRERGLIAPGKPLELDPRDLVSIIFPHLHPETECFEFDSRYFCDTATSVTFSVAGDKGVVLLSFHYAPLLIDYAGLEKHEETYFDDGGTTDGRYIAMHFRPEDVETIDDSDRLLLASFTPADEYYYPVTNGLLKRLPLVRTWYKIYLIRKTLSGPMGDEVKRRYFARPLRIHSAPLSDSWTRVEARARRIAAKALKPPGVSDAVFSSVCGLSAWAASLSLTRACLRHESGRAKAALRRLASRGFDILFAGMPEARRRGLKTRLKRLAGG